MSISRRLPTVTIEYLSRGRRVTKHFTNAYVARSFYVKKLNTGKEPRIVKAPQS